MSHFNYDVRAGFAHVLETVGKGIGEMYDVEPERIDANDPSVRDELPDGAAALLAILFATGAGLMVFSDTRSASMLSRMSEALMPLIIECAMDDEPEGEPN